jgi:hypothetical protein
VDLEVKHENESFFAVFSYTTLTAPDGVAIMLRRFPLLISVDLASIKVFMILLHIINLLQDFTNIAEHREW